MNKIFSKIRKTALLFFLVIISNTNIFSQAGTYYNSISTTSSTFVSDLKSRIRSPYTRVSYDNFDNTNIANFASYNNGNGTRSVICVYSGYEYVYIPPFSWGVMSREHTYAHSWMPTFPSTSNDQYSDQYQLFPTHQNNANGRRSNHPLGEVQNVTYQFLEGKVGTNSQGQIVYEPRNSHKGDAARSLLYMSVRYDDVSGNSWNFDWLNNTRLPSLSEAPQDTSILYKWNRQDPPDKWEVDRNNYIQSIQQNRNPFVDHPEYVSYVNFYNMTKYNPSYSAEPVNYVTSFNASSNGPGIELTWNDATGAQLPSGYLIIAYDKDNYFLPIDGSVYQNDSILSDGYALMNIPYSNADSYIFNGLTPNKTYYFSIFSYNGSGALINYKINGAFPQSNATATFILADEPSNHVTGLSTDNITNSSMRLNWTDALPGSQAPSGYIILANNNNNFTNPSDGVNYSNDTNLSDGTATVNVNYNSPDNYEFTGLNPNTNYYFRVYSYNGTGTQINYKTNGTIPNTSAYTTGATLNTGTVLLDNFNRSNNSVLGYTLPPDVLNWQETETQIPNGIILNSEHIKFLSTTAGRDFAYVNVSGKTGYPIQYSSSTGQLVWAFNFRQSRTDPSGFDGNNYGAAFIIGKTTSDITTGDGYAVILGQSGSTDPIRLAKFTGGVNLNSKFTNVISGGDYANQYLSIKVVYESAGDNWQLFVDSDVSDFPHSDPRDASNLIGSISDNTYTSSSLVYLGAMWNHATGAGDSLITDDIYVPSAISSLLNLKVIPEGYFNTGASVLNARDSLKVILRNSSAPYTIVDSSTVEIDSVAFTGSFNFENAASGNYYIAVKSKNTIETWSKLPIVFTAGSVHNYDFTLSASMAYGDNMKLKNSGYCIYSGDTDQDGLIDLTDLIQIYNAAAIFTTGYANTDLSGDRVTDLTDLVIANNNSSLFVSKIIPG
ncbi:MAG: endonuclease [Ignavibacteriae bacterium]|nr:endonuclease [Ignavibacteriota bacterium]